MFFSTIILRQHYVSMLTTLNMLLKLAKNSILSDILPKSMKLKLLHILGRLCTMRLSQSQLLPIARSTVDCRIRKCLLLWLLPMTKRVTLWKMYEDFATATVAYQDVFRLITHLCNFTSTIVALFSPLRLQLYTNLNYFIYFRCGPAQ